MAVILSACLCLSSVNFVWGYTGNENWKSAYINYLRNGIKNNWAKNGKGGYSYEGYALIDIDGNDIPELYMMGNSTASGDQICTYNNGKVVEKNNNIVNNDNRNKSGNKVKNGISKDHPLYEKYKEFMILDE